jgi:four helix bundle protein
MRFEKLHVWKRSAKLGVDICKHFDYSRAPAPVLIGELVRSALEIPSRIAEASERPPGSDHARLLLIAKRNCGALRSYLYLAAQLGHVDRPTTARWLMETRHITEMLSTLIRALPRHLPADKKPPMPPSIASQLGRKPPTISGGPEDQ